MISAGHKEGTGRLATLRSYSDRARLLFRRGDIDLPEKTRVTSLPIELHSIRTLEITLPTPQMHILHIIKHRTQTLFGGIRICDKVNDTYLILVVPQ